MLPIEVNAWDSRRVEERLAPTNSNGCREWTGYRTPKGYGRISIRNKDRGSSLIYVHRYVATAKFGPLPHDRVVDHICENPPCANPDHLQLLTIGDNLRRSR